MDKLFVLKDIAESEFSDIILDIIEKEDKIRIILKDKSFIDVYVSIKVEDRFSFHWECKDERIYRYDNFPDKKARNLKSFPFHFHEGSQDNIEEPWFSQDIEYGFRDFMKWIRTMLIFDAI